MGELAEAREARELYAEVGRLRARLAEVEAIAQDHRESGTYIDPDRIMAAARGEAVRG